MKTGNSYSLQEWHAAYNEIHARVPFLKRTFGIEDPADSPGADEDVPDTVYEDIVCASDQMSAAAALDPPLCRCGQQILIAPPKMCLKCSIACLNPFEVQSEIWLNDSSNPPVFRFKQEYIARLNFLQSKLDQVTIPALTYNRTRDQP